MHRAFLKQTIKTKLDMLEAAQEILGIDRINIEKDFWMCWVLEKLFLMKNNQFVFKGGTTLSKVYEVIDRYSEDIDITVNYSHFIGKVDFAVLSNTQIAKLSTKLKEKLTHYLDKEIIPYLGCVATMKFCD